MLKQMEKTVNEIGLSFRKVDWSDVATYANFLSQSYYIARQSTSFLGLTMIHSSAYPEFIARCTDHISEETGHEKLIINDLKQLGHSLFPELPQTSAVYQPQYYRIVAQHPLSFMGYVFFLEMIGPAHGRHLMNNVTNEKAVSFLKVHTIADEDHFEKAKAVFATLPVDLHGAILSNFEMTAGSYRQLLEKMAEASSRLRVAA